MGPSEMLLGFSHLITMYNLNSIKVKYILLATTSEDENSNSYEQSVVQIATDSKSCFYGRDNSYHFMYP